MRSRNLQLMKRTLMTIVLLFAFTATFAQWSPRGEKIKTKWADEINPENVLPEYPRPIMERDDWKNLNGLWDLAILPVGEQKPGQFNEQILVPYPVESSLSGVMKEVGKDKEVWYHKTFTLPSEWKGKETLLHFGAVDWKADVWVNDVKVGSHSGGYTPFSFNISSALKKSGQQELTVRVWDPTNDGFQPRGKQVNRPEGIWYTPVTGIWQTVWIEPVQKLHIEALKTTPDIDKNKVTIAPVLSEATTSSLVEVKVYDGSTLLQTVKSSATEPVEIVLKDPRLWSPDSPFLYDVTVSLTENGKVIDKVESYFAMRKVSTRRDGNGILRLQLNNEDLFQFGPLDQGWWPDGLYTAPTDEALKYDIVKTKELGYNMIRKHVKVEPARWYTYCDQMGMLVWQDMPSGDGFQHWQNFNMHTGPELVRTYESEQNFRKEWKEIIDYLYSYPSIVTWVPFNEAWGQFKTVEITNWTKNYDPTRLVNSASGGNHFSVGDMLDLHHYPHPAIKLIDGSRANVLGEYGGIGLVIDGHIWEPDRNWGYVQFKNKKEVTEEYIKYAEMLLEQIRAGYSAAVYTQTTDVEVEVNGLMTYDREIIKVEEKAIREINQKICNALK